MKRNKNTYQKIADRFKVKQGYVKDILKIGRTKPENFPLMRRGRLSRYASVNDAKKEEEGELPEVPRVQAPVYFSSPSLDINLIEGGYQLKSDPPQVEEEPREVLQQLEEHTIQFACPGGCKHEYIINLKNMSYEQVR